MSRFIRTSSGAGGAGLTSSDVCSILCTYQGTLSAANACLVCNLRTEYEIICYCQYWTTCYGSCLIFSLPTTEYSEFKLGFFGLFNCQSDSTSILFGNDTNICFCGYCSNVFAWPMSSCVISCLGPTACAVCFSSPLNCNQSSFIFNLRRTWGYTSEGLCFSCPIISYDACFRGDCYCTQLNFYGTTISSCCLYWRDTAASDTFTRLSISNSTGIRSCNGYWYILGKKNRILDI